jgi:hypothetical protein
MVSECYTYKWSQRPIGIRHNEHDTTGDIGHELRYTGLEKKKRMLLTGLPINTTIEHGTGEFEL